MQTKIWNLRLAILTLNLLIAGLFSECRGAWSLQEGEVEGNVEVHFTSDVSGNAPSLWQTYGTWYFNAFDGSSMLVDQAAVDAAVGMDGSVLPVSSYATSGGLNWAAGWSQFSAAVVSGGGGGVSSATNFDDAAVIMRGVSDGGLNVFWILLPAGLVVGLSLWGYKNWRKSSVR